MSPRDDQQDIVKNLGRHLCWSCREEAGEGPFCRHCVKIQPVQLLGDYFHLFGIEPAFRIDEKRIRQTYYDLSRQFHPDYYGALSEGEKEIARDNTAYLHTAISVLLDPVRRADYLLARLKQQVAANPSPPHPLLADILEAGEILLEEILAPDQLARLAEASRKFATLREQLLDDLERLFARLVDGVEDTANDITARLDNIKYLRTIIRRIDDRLREQGYGEYAGEI